MEHFRNAVYAILIPLPLGLFLAMHPPYFAQLQICVSAWPHPYSVAGKNPVVKKRSGRNTLIPSFSPGENTSIRIPCGRGYISILREPGKSRKGFSPKVRITYAHKVLSRFLQQRERCLGDGMHSPLTFPYPAEGLCWRMRFPGAAGNTWQGLPLL
jgi:hypothetical protein